MKIDRFQALRDRESARAANRAMFQAPPQPEYRRREEQAYLMEQALRDEIERVRAMKPLSIAEQVEQALTQPRRTRTPDRDDMLDVLKYTMNLMTGHQRTLPRAAGKSIFGNV